VIVLRPFALALTFLTRVPLTVRGIKDQDFGAAVAWFPAVGLLLGIVLAATAHVARGHLSAELLALALVTLLVALTGGLHLDGVADVFDGLAGGRGSRERTLEIMRDSRIGAFGAAAVVLALLAKVFAILELERCGTSWAIVAFPLAARWAVCPLVVCFPYAREQGLGKPFKGHVRPAHLVFATSLTAAALVLAAPDALGPTLAALATSLVLAWWMQRRIGGLTGDVYGCAIELGELAFLIAATLRFET
jgi:adenosylcobinamide-GDP ribazoletransferase